jgi:hypothetical protein
MALKLKPWDEFTAGMAGIVAKFDPELREHVLIALYHMASHRQWLEDIREKVKSKAPQLHRERIQVQRFRKRVQTAVKAVRKANEGGNHGFLVRDSLRDALQPPHRIVGIARLLTILILMPVEQARVQIVVEELCVRGRRRSGRRVLDLVQK